MQAHKDIQGKEEVELLLRRDGMIMNAEKSQEIYKKLLEMINESRKVSGYTVNIQKNIYFCFVVVLKCPQILGQSSFKKIDSNTLSLYVGWS